jgi:hypothetical protein
MKKVIALLAITVFALSGCNDDTGSEQTYNERTHYDTLIISGEQVWLRNYSANKVSQVYEKYNEKNYRITVLSEYFNDEMGEYIEYEIGSGRIDRGKLSFTVDVPNKDNLLEWDVLEVFFNIIAEGEGWDVEIDEKAIKGTFIEIQTDDEAVYALMKESVSGTTSSVSDETVYFFYVDRDCTISGKSKEDEQVMYTFNPFALKLKRGWNTVWYKQTYTTFGRSSFFLDIKNPGLKWVLFPTVPTM